MSPRKSEAQKPETRNEVREESRKEKAAKYPLRDIHGQKYLEVKYRIMWFREDHPDWSIETECIQADKDSSLFKAIIRDEKGRVISTGHKRESRQNFPDHHEKAETGAVGRALALIGYGTQFAMDIDEGDRIVDAPAGETREGAPSFAQENRPYRVPFGKYKERPLEEIDPHELQGYCAYIERKAREESKPLHSQVREFLARANQHLNSLEASAQEQKAS